ncbi:MAG TPA: 2Fe-2S iron-sulfur cluster-binding protein, partial [Burkholderiaceae bacterium]|nr:2Fe-2S iron-sulfur cluster-binding protein [Burkholderiaceae bacterium]
MSFNVVVRPSGREFAVESGESILAAAMRHGITLPYGCRDGACGTCKAKVLVGTVEHGPHQVKA